jgi:hypothetical protein
MRSLLAGLLSVLVVVLLAAPPPGSAQTVNDPPDSEYLIELRNRSFVPEPGIEVEAILATRDGGPDGSPGAVTPLDQVHFLLQLWQLPDSGRRAAFERAAGVDLLSPVGGRAYVASMPADEVGNLEQFPDLVRWAGPLVPGDKVSADLLDGEIGVWAVLPPDDDPPIITGDGAADGTVTATDATEPFRVVLTFQLHADRGPEDARELIGRFGGEPLAFIPASDTYSAVFDLAAVDPLEIAADGSVLTLDVAAPTLDDLNDGAREAIGADVLNAAPYGLTGDGVNVLVYDSGQIDDQHDDFDGRILSSDDSPIRRHSIHVAGTVGGDGANSDGVDSAGNANGGAPGQWAGMAPQVGFHTYGSIGAGGLSTSDVFYDDGGDLFDDFTSAIEHAEGTDLATVSQGNNVVPNGFPCSQLGDYTNVAILIDDIVRGSIGDQPLIYFQAAGNERGGAATCGTTFSTIPSPATLKNGIVVGAINSNDDSMTGFSSWGPTDDGRLRPDVVAPGCQVGGDGGITSPAISTAQLQAGSIRNTYRALCGTSMATPAAAGVGALLIEQWRDLHGAGARPEPHTMKALLTHTATDLGTEGPDYTFGFGAVDAVRAADLVIADADTPLIHLDAVDQGGEREVTFDSNGSQPVRATLVWDDPSGTRLAANALVNDLDLALIDPGGGIHQPWLLDPADPGAAATTGTDTRNVVEQADAPAMAGTWTARVTGSAVPDGPQDYTVILSHPDMGNEPPSLDLTIGTADEGDPVQLDIEVTDPDGDDLSVRVDWGFGAVVDPVVGMVTTGPEGTTFEATISHVYGDDGDFPVEVCADDGTVEVCETVVAVIANVDPDPVIDVSGATVVDGVPYIIATVGETITFSARTTDPGSDDLQLTWDLGDGTTSTTVSLVNPPNPDPPLSPSIQPRDVTDTVDHAYVDACAYLATHTAVDDDGGVGSDEVAVLIVGDADRVRSAGYWQEIYRPRPGSPFDQATLLCYLQIVDALSQVFSEVTPADTLAAAHAVLRPPPARDAVKNLERQLLAAWLNLANGGIGWDELVDSTGDGVVDTTFGDVVQTAEAVRLDPTATRAALLAQKDVLERINVRDG